VNSVFGLTRTIKHRDIEAVHCPAPGAVSEMLHYRLVLESQQRCIRVPADVVVLPAKSAVQPSIDSPILSASDINQKNPLVVFF